MTRRMVIALVSVLSISWIAACGLGVMVMQDEFAEIFDSGVQETADRLLPLIEEDFRERSPEAQRRLVQSSSGTEYLTYQVRDKDGAVLLHSHDGAVEGFDVPLTPGFADTDTQRVYTVATPQGDLYLQVADSFANRREAIVEAATALILPVLVLIPASIFAVIVVIRRTLAPIQALRDDIGRKDSGNLAPVDTQQLPSELHPIARSVNMLLERLRSALESERSFASNSAHELRTPIAGALAQTQRLRADIPPHLAPRVDQIELSLSNLAQLSEKLLQMARADAGIGISDREVDLIPVIELVLQDMARSGSGEGRICLHRRETERFSGQFNPDAFAIVMRNLLENALTHSPAGTPVDVYIEAERVIRIVNGGPPVDPLVLPRLTARFMRGATQAPGSGLGLAIVKNLVERMQGVLTLTSPAPGRRDGFEARIDFPLQDPG